MRLHWGNLSSPPAYLSLRKGNFDVVFPQLLFDRKKQLASEPPGRGRHFLGPNRQFETERIVTKPDTEQLRFRLLQCFRMFGGDVEHKPSQLFQIGPVSHAERDPKPD